MILIENNYAIIEFKKGPFANNSQECISLAMEMLNLSKSFNSLINKGKVPGKKMNKTGRIRIGIQKFVNKDGVNPIVIDKLIGLIRVGGLKQITVQVGEKGIDLSPNEDVSGLIASLMLKRII